MFSKKIIIFGLLGVATAGGAFWYFNGSRKKNVSLIETVKPLVKDLKQYVNAPGTLKAKDQITIGSLIAGRIIKLYVDDNSVVKKNQLLVEIDNGIGDSQVKQFKHQIQQAKAQLVYQEEFYKRQKALYDIGQLARNAFDQTTSDLIGARENVKQLEAQLEVAQKAYDNCFIKSPGNGIVIAKKVDLGQMIAAVLQPTELFIIAEDLTKMEVDMDVDEADVGVVKDGQAVNFTVDAFPKNQYKGTVSLLKYLSKTVENVVTYAAVIYVDNKDLKLRPTMTADVWIEVANVKDALCVPNRALRVSDTSLQNVAKLMGYSYMPLENKAKHSKEDFVWVQEGKTVKQVAVVLGANDGKYTQVLSGINKDSQVIIDTNDASQSGEMLKEMFKGKGGIG